LKEAVFCVAVGDVLKDGAGLTVSLYIWIVLDSPASVPNKL